MQDWEDTQQDGRYVNLVKAVTGLDVLQRWGRAVLDLLRGWVDRVP